MQTNTVLRRSFPVLCKAAMQGPRRMRRVAHVTPRIQNQPSRAVQSDAAVPEEPSKAVSKGRGMGKGKGLGRGRNMMSPFRMMQEFERDMDDMMNAFGFMNLPKRQEIFRPGSKALAIDIVEEKDGFLIKADIPGLSAEDVNVQVSPDHILTISGERSNEYSSKPEEEGPHVMERFYGSFSRSFKLPDHVDVHAIKAEASHGVLQLTVPKVVHEEAENRVISIPVSSSSSPTQE
mmetsp:Transcript_477/g.1097  ORF Transcript_477/g.1097 Transcript_477/m.1097 type:complete len:234 (-) Transcript_477:60-761(-)|eukprot:CAMPEP_0118801474 /NCGR_PEP_ID=MMETSP1161-20130426/3010_1 /TAXON_ID=249345 /ORGANISM="Picochlorum oklahomensis, Strain CCMP2329" /LENGTH=233 /DNA_ID=CAMNT_0006729405 /DNA_START=573 /DNA_END=1274 /DNA_ORIENTATION=+